MLGEVRIQISLITPDLDYAYVTRLTMGSFMGFILVSLIIHSEKN